jgi:hypothetical protein
VMGCGPGALLQRCLRTRWRYRTVVALCLSLVVGVNVGLFLQIASVADEALDPDPPLAPGAFPLLGGLSARVCGCDLARN